MNDHENVFIFIITISYQAIDGCKQEAYNVQNQHNPFLASFHVVDEISFYIGHSE